MLLNKDSEYNIQQRQQGKDCLSWIENFGLHLFEKECIPKVSFKNDEVDEIVVLRINKKENTICTYYCSFKTDGKGYTRFCVNKAVDDDATGLKELMDKAKWTDESTKEYWKEVFRDGKQDVDEDTLKRPEVLAYADAQMVMIDFIEQIKNEFEKAVHLLSIDNAKISKVFIVEQYAKALPVQYSLRKIFPNAENVFDFLYWEKRYSWSQKANRFYIPEELLHAELNTSSKMIIGDVIKLGENGIVITLPVEEKDGKYCMPSISIIKGCGLKWCELIKGGVQYDYKVGNLLFKRVQLSMIADGFQTVYIKCDTDVVACSEYENGKYQIKSLSPKKSEEAQKATVSKPQLSKKSNGEKSVPEITTDSSETTRTNTPSKEARHQISTMIFDGSDRFIIVARKNIETFFKKKYQDKWDIKFKEAFCKGIYKNLDFGNFPSFITDNKDLLIEYWGGENSYYQVKNSAYALHKLRNKNDHHEIDTVINQGKAEVTRVFSDMIRVVKIMGDTETAKKIEDLNLKLDTIWWIK